MSEDDQNDKPWEPNREPPIDVKNEIRMSDLNEMMVKDGWSWTGNPGHTGPPEDIIKQIQESNSGILGQSNVEPSSTIGESKRKEFDGE